MNDESKSTVSKWQDEHRQKLAAQGIELPDEPPVHCSRCHRNIPTEEHPKHYRECPGFTSGCYETCPPADELKTGKMRG